MDNKAPTTLLSIHSILGGRWDKNLVGAKLVSIDCLSSSRVRDIAHDPLGLCWVFLGPSLLPRVEPKVWQLCVTLKLTGKETLRPHPQISQV